MDTERAYICLTFCTKVNAIPSFYIIEPHMELSVRPLFDSLALSSSNQPLDRRGRSEIDAAQRSMLEKRYPPLSEA